MEKNAKEGVKQPTGGKPRLAAARTETRIAIELAAPFRPYARPEELSRLRIRIHGERVFEIRWDKAGSFSASASSTTGPGRPLASTAAASTTGRSASEITPVVGGSGVDQRREQHWQRK